MGGTGYTFLLKNKIRVEEWLFSSSSGSDNPTSSARRRRRRRDRSGGGGGGTAPAAAPRLTRSTSPPPLQRPGAPRRAAYVDVDGRPDTGDDLKENKKPLLAMFHSNRIVQQKIKILSQRYAHFRRTREVGSCFYRAFLFSYLENLGQLPDRQAEVARLMQHVAASKPIFCRLSWDKALFSNAEEYFTSVMDEFNDLVNLVANGPTPDERLESCLQAMGSPRSSRIIFWLRLLAETDIRTRGQEYKSLDPQNFNAIVYCYKEGRARAAEVNVLAGRALTYALDIPLRVETVDADLKDQIAEVKCLDFFPRSESGKGPYHAVLSKWSSSTPPTAQQIGSCDLLSSDRTPLLTLMCVREPRCWYILYR